MLRLRLLPWEYGVRNLFRRPSRSGLTLLALTTAVLLVFVVVAFVRGLETSLAASGNPSVVLVYSIGAAGDVENSAVAQRTPGLLSASLSGIDRRYGVSYVSPELYVAAKVVAGDGGTPRLGLLRGVTPAAALLRKQVQIVEGSWPGPGEVMIGRLAATKLGCRPDALALGGTVVLDGRQWRISGRFAADGSAFESEIWCPLADLQQALKRQDLSLVAVGLARGASAADVEMFCKERLDLELQAVAETEYYAALQRHYRPVRMLGWLLVALIGGAGAFAGLNIMYGAVVGRVRELSTLQAVGFRRRAIALTLVQEGTLLAASASLIAASLALALVNGMAVRFTMGAIVLRVDSVGVLVGCATGLALGAIGAIPPAIKAMGLPVAEGLKAV